MEIQAFDTQATALRLCRRGLLAGLAATLAVPALAAVGPKPAVRGATRRLKMVSLHTGEEIDTIYCRGGVYDPGAVRAINRLMRDWRTGEIVEMDVQGIDLWADLHERLGSRQPLQLISGYRSPETNAQLRAGSPGVAKSSYHMRGMAADLRVADRSLAQIAQAAAEAGAGGIGIYPGSDFVHVDTGPSRRWRG